MLRRMGSFDVALLEALLPAGVSPERARAVVDLFERSVDERYSLHAQAGFAAEAKAGIAGVKDDLVKWVVGALTAQTALLLGVSTLR
jgi:hypothetical protein